MRTLRLTRVNVPGRIHKKGRKCLTYGQKIRMICEERARGGEGVVFPWEVANYVTGGDLTSVVVWGGRNSQRIPREGERENKPIFRDLLNPQQTGVTKKRTGEGLHSAT